MDWVSILPLAGIVLGAIFLAFSIFLFIIKKGGVAGPMLMAGVLAAGLGSYYFITGESAGSTTTASSEDETPEDDQQKEETEEKEASEEKSVANDDTEEESTPEEDSVASDETEEAAHEESEENETSEPEGSKEEETEEPDSTDGQSNEDEEPTTGEAGGGAEEYEYSALYYLNDVFEELAYVAVSTESYYNDDELDSEYYVSATDDIFSMDEAIANARELQNPPEGYGEFQVTYQKFLDEMQDYSDNLYEAIEGYEYGYDDGALEEIITNTNTPVVDAVEVMSTESDDVFEYLDLRYEIQNADWEEDFYYD